MVHYKDTCHGVSYSRTNITLTYTIVRVIRTFSTMKRYIPWEQLFTNRHYIHVYNLQINNSEDRYIESNHIFETVI